MINLLTKRKSEIIYKSLIFALAVISAVILPQIFHAIGQLSGNGAAVGQAFLPMHLPVLLAGLFGGGITGLLAGILSPLLSFAISSMPTVTLLPFMMIELAVYGLVAGLLKKVKTPVFIKLLIIQVVGRLVRAAAIIIAIYVFKARGLSIRMTYNIVQAGLFGIALQWALIPLFCYRLKALNKF